MQRHFLPFTAILVGVTLALGACSNPVRQAAPAAIYDFGLPPARLPGVPQGLRLALDVRAPQWLDVLPVGYRLAYDDSLKLRHYTTSRWAGPPSQLLGQRLRQQLGLSAGGSATNDCLLRLELQEFSQVFEQPQSSHAVLQLNAQIIDARRQPLGDKLLALQRPAVGADAQGGVAALAAAGDAAAQEIAAWLQGLAREGHLGSCRPPTVS